MFFFYLNLYCFNDFTRLMLNLYLIKHELNYLIYNYYFNGK